MRTSRKGAHIEVGNHTLTADKEGWYVRHVDGPLNNGKPYPNVHAAWAAIVEDRIRFSGATDPAQLEAVVVAAPTAIEWEDQPFEIVELDSFEQEPNTAREWLEWAQGRLPVQNDS